MILLVWDAQVTVSPSKSANSNLSLMHDSYLMRRIDRLMHLLFIYLFSLLLQSVKLTNCPIVWPRWTSRPSLPSCPLLPSLPSCPSFPSRLIIWTLMCARFAAIEEGDQRRRSFCVVRIPIIHTASASQYSYCIGYIVAWCIMIHSWHASEFNRFDQWCRPCHTVYMNGTDFVLRRPTFEGPNLEKHRRHWRRSQSDFRVPSRDQKETFKRKIL